MSLQVSGYDAKKCKVTDFGGGIYLVDPSENVAASWKFEDLLSHWVRKHAKAAYVPSLISKDSSIKYRYGGRVRLAEGTDFLLFIRAVASGAVYYDPGIKIEQFSGGKPLVKKRSQFRIRSAGINVLYRNVEEVNLAEARLSS